VLVLYTDGLIERDDESLDAGLERLAGAVAAAKRDPDAVCDAILDSLLPEGPSHDDVALLVARPSPLGDPLLLRIAADVDGIPLLRRVIGRWLAEAGASPSEVEDMALAFSEACANAAEHAYAPAEGSIEVQASVSDTGMAVVSIRDFGSWRSPRGQHRGRGLVLMEGLMDSVDLIREDAGTTVQLSRQLKDWAA
jgi:anti-sigma regulatory factor (Ser/Thr protein kinase)